MNNRWSILLGVLATVIASLAGLVLIPNWQLQDTKQIEDDNGDLRPQRLEGTESAGRRVYIDLGCIYCHSQQVRPPGFGADIERGWGNRRTVARDYMFDMPHLLGTMRTGPDLANIGARQNSREWFYLHFYNPQITSPGSIMPQFPFLFDKVPASAPRSSDAVRLPEKWSSTPAFIVPKNRARDLVTYLLTLDKSYDVPEAH